MTILATLFASFRPAPIQAEHQKYIGFWQATSGSFVEIFANGLGNCAKIARPGQTQPAQLMNSAVVTIETTTLMLRRRGATVRFVIEQEPSFQNGRISLVLDGCFYIKELRQA